MAGWIGVDLDGTLAEYNGWVGPDHIGRPIQGMVTRVKEWIKAGYEVRIFTARASDPEQIPPIERWAEQVFGFKLPVTNCKDFGMIELWDDRAVGVVTNEGRIRGALEA